MSTADLLLEIGSEEIPAEYVPAAAQNLLERVSAWLEAQGIGFDRDASEVFATPRRLAVRMAAVEAEQPRRTETRLGPAVKAAFKPDGSPTPAAEGFARSAGTTVEALQRVETEKGERLAAEVTTGGASTRELLLAPEAVLGFLQLGFPKTMRWIPGSDLRYARPIRWLVCLYGDEVVPLEVGGLVAGRESRGHRTLAPGPVTISRPASYEDELARARVIARASRRSESIYAEAVKAAKSVGGTLHEADDLLEEVTYLVEHPHPVVGSFEPAVVDVLPPEVIVTAMRSHQRYFSVEEEAGGRLRPHFITFRDGGDADLANVVEGNERVLRARLDDAQFYWNEDRALGSDEKIERLGRIVWLEGMGSVKDKCERIAQLAAALATEFDAKVDGADLRRACMLCKSDLATEMIRDGKEFTKLQGAIGRYYALEAGEKEAVADAIREHLHPRFAEDRLPADALSTLVALADRLDSIAGCTLAGFAPTGGQDPYALRRQALAVLRILREREWHLDLEVWVGRALEPFPDAKVPPAEAAGAILDLFWGRLESALSELPAEIVRAVLSVSRLDPLENVAAARALDAFRGSDSFDRLLEGAKRCRNILVKEERLHEESLEGTARARALREAAGTRWTVWLRHAADGAPMGFDPERFEDDAERALHRAVVERVGRLDGARRVQDHEGVFGALSELGGPIADYFDAVLVNAPDPAVRANRLSFLEDIHYLFARFADLSRASAARR